MVTKNGLDEASFCGTFFDFRFFRFSIFVERNKKGTVGTGGQRHKPESSHANLTDSLKSRVITAFTIPTPNHHKHNHNHHP